VPGRRSDAQSLRLLGRAIRELREQRGLSIEALAAAAGLHFTYVVGLERGRKNPSYHQLLRLADGLGVQPIALLLWIEELDTHEPAD
jgi:transcriptional regulator with XRE-family HTH domain